MRVFDLCCDRNHRFEGWFGNEADFSTQQASGLLNCPLCESVSVRRLPSAPRLNLGAVPPAIVDSAGSRPMPDALMEDPSVQVSRHLLQAVRHILNQTQDVGRAFPTQARAMHEGELPAAPIRGTASVEEVQSLLEDGVEVFSLPDLPVLKETLQ